MDPTEVILGDDHWAGARALRKAALAPNGCAPKWKARAPDENASVAETLDHDADNFWGQWHHGMFAPRPPPEFGLMGATLKSDQRFILRTQIAIRSAMGHVAICAGLGDDP